MRTVCVLILLTGCGGVDVITTDSAPRELTTSVEPEVERGCLAANAVDLLLVIDGSGSMAETLDGLGDELGQLVDAGLASGLDYRIGVSNTDDGPAAGALRTCPPLYPTWLTRDLERDIQKDWLSCVTGELGTNQSDFAESALAAARAALERNPEFARPSARLTVVIITDENDQSIAGDWVDFFGELKPASLFELVTIAGPPPSGCEGAEPNLVGYDVTAALAGQFLSICDPMSTSMAAVADTAFAPLPCP